MCRTALAPAQNQLWNRLGQKDVCKIDFFGFEPNVLKDVPNVRYKKYITGAHLNCSFVDKTNYIPIKLNISIV